MSKYPFLEDDGYPAPPPITKEQAAMMKKAAHALAEDMAKKLDKILLEVFTQSFLTSPKNQDPL